MTPNHPSTADTSNTLDLDTLRRWVGKSRVTTDTIRAQPVAAMRATLDRPAVMPELGESLPPAWHWLFFHEAARLQELGRDGHVARGGFLPPVALPRRMWAGGRLSFIEPIIIGETIRKHSTVTAVARKTGRSGELCFVTVRHEFSGKSRQKIIEEHNIVYREETTKEHSTPSMAPQEADKIARITATSVMLFRYSALTFNSHRIHYDLDYCRVVERLPGLVVHGPLIATLLAGMAAEQGAVREFAYRAVGPLFAEQPFTIACKARVGQLDLWATNADGELAMRATASV